MMNRAEAKKRIREAIENYNCMIISEGSAEWDESGMMTKKTALAIDGFELVEVVWAWNRDEVPMFEDELSYEWKNVRNFTYIERR